MTTPPVYHAALACPVCDAPLERELTAFVCPNGHCFDVAKEGYVNLLPSQHRSRGMEGDVAEMLRARRRFLDAGHFEPLRRALANEVEAVLARRERTAAANVVEVGCGEGYYIGGVAEGRAGSEAVRLLGTDLSKAAVKLASKRYPHVLFFVADVHRRIYLQDASAAVLIDVFAPRDATEFARVLEPGGSALIVIPAQAHLADARETLGLLAIQPEKERRLLDSFADGFRLADRHELRYPLDLTAEDVRDLVEMGPNHWHGRGPTTEEPMRTEAAFVLLRLERDPG